MGATSKYDYFHSILAMLIALILTTRSLAKEIESIPQFVKENIQQLVSAQSSIPLLEHYLDGIQKLEQSDAVGKPSPCKLDSQVKVRLELQTDTFPSDTSWEFLDRSRNATLMKASNTKYSSLNLDIREVCLDRGEYEYTLYDTFGDGLCCNHGRGYYKIFYQRDDGSWQLVVAGSQFESTEVHHIFIQDGRDFQLTCKPPQKKITFEIFTDQYGNDTSWEFKQLGGPIIATNERVYGAREVDSRDFCVDDSSLYELTIYDDYGDGMCCHYGKGHYKIIIDSDETLSGKETILYGGYFQAKSSTYLLNTTQVSMSNRDELWLKAHNKRRKKWHAHYDTSYVPLRWSEALKEEAQEWANHLLGSCGKGMFHDSARITGENAAGNSGTGSWAEMRSPEQILTRFVEREVDDPWPKNGHLTQTLWRASKYVGCAEAHKHMEGEKECHTQVCRYARTGNCNMNSYVFKNGTINWLKPMLEDINFCGPPCPSDGCKA